MFFVMNELKIEVLGLSGYVDVVYFKVFGDEFMMNDVFEGENVEYN